VRVVRDKQSGEMKLHLLLYGAVLCLALPAPLPVPETTENVTITSYTNTTTSMLSHITARKTSETRKRLRERVAAKLFNLARMRAYDELVRGGTGMTQSDYEEEHGAGLVQEATTPQCQALKVELDDFDSHVVYFVDTPMDSIDGATRQVHDAASDAITLEQRVKTLDSVAGTLKTACNALKIMKSVPRLRMTGQVFDNLGTLIGRMRSSLVTPLKNELISFNAVVTMPLKEKAIEVMDANEHAAEALWVGRHMYNEYMLDPMLYADKECGSVTATTICHPNVRRRMGAVNSFLSQTRSSLDALSGLLANWVENLSILLPYISYNFPGLINQFFDVFDTFDAVLEKRVCMPEPPGGSLNPSLSITLSVLLDRRCSRRILGGSICVAWQYCGSIKGVLNTIGDVANFLDQIFDPIWRKIEDAIPSLNVANLLIAELENMLSNVFEGLIPEFPSLPSLPGFPSLPNFRLNLIGLGCFIAPDPPRYCSAGLTAGGVCCDPACGTCGGSGCSGRGGKNRKCCVSEIVELGKQCGSSTDTSCVLPPPQPANLALVLTSGGRPQVNLASCFDLPSLSLDWLRIVIPDFDFNGFPNVLPSIAYPFFTCPASPLQRSPPPPSPAPPAPAYCIGGIPSDNGNRVCCAASCGRCGGTKCGRLPGGDSKCCQGDILSRNRACAYPMDTACVMPA